MFSQSFMSMFKRVLVVTALLPAMLRGDGLIILNPIHHHNKPVPLRLNVEYHRVIVSISNQVATTKVDQVFENPYDHAVEGTYIFPIPAQASLHQFKMHVNGKPLNTKLFTKEEARRTYESLVHTHKDPALLEYLDHGMVQATIASIPPKGKIQVKLEYTELLTADNGTIKYYYTLGTEKFSAQPLKDVSITLDIQSSQPLVNVFCPTHAVDVQTPNLTQAYVTYKEQNVRPDRDFILYYTLPQDDLGFNVLTYKNGKEDGFFLAMVSPNSDKSVQPIVAKNIIFVVDISGSMSGKKLVQAKEALVFCLNNLNREDRFNVIAFDDSIRLYKNNLVPATQDNVGQAVSFVQALDVRGSTDIDTALKTALQQCTTSDNPTMIIFLTDGCPTVGECNIGAIIKNTKQANASKVRLFSFGIGHDVNTTLLDKISLDNKGVSDYVTPDETIEGKVTSFYRKVANPVLTDVAIAFAGTQVKEIYPVDVPDLFLGSQLLVIGRYTSGGPVTMQVAGKQNGAEKQFAFPCTFVSNDTINDFLPRLWAGRKIAHLTDQIVLNGSNQELVDHIIALSRQYGIMTPYTSFLVDLSAQEFAKGIVTDAMKQQAAQTLNSAVHKQTGEDSVMRSLYQKSLREGSSVAMSYSEGSAERAQDMSEMVRPVKARTFYFKDGMWIDAGHTDVAPLIKIKAFSIEYFNLINLHPEVRPYLALGTKVMVATDQGSISIED